MEPYRVTLVGKRPFLSGDLLFEYTYKFTSSKNGESYYVIVEEYKIDFYAVKFYLAKHKNHKRRYQYLTYNNNVFGVINTIFSVIINIHKNNENANFGYIAAQTFYGLNNEQNRPEKEEFDLNKGTKRYKIYKWFINRLVGNLEFDHYPFVKHNAYLLISRKWPDTHQKAVEIRQMIADMYDMEELFG